jgi:CMP-N,N'-diacetyllegionaminic acid synthase
MATYCIDIDGVVCTLVENCQYEKAQPIQENIDRINALYDAGHKIIFYTARGDITKRNLTGLTMQQLEDWGVKHHRLVFGKPAADYYVDDKMISVIDLSQYDV